MRDRRGPGLADEHIGEFETFFRASHRRTLAAVVLLVRDVAEAEDVVQEAYERVARNWTVVRTYDAPGAWVRRIAYNLAVSRLRRARRIVLTPLTERVQNARTFHTHPLQDREEPEALLALRRLPQRYRVVLALRYVWEFSTAEVAAELGLPVNTVKTQLARGRTLLAAELRRAGIVGPAEPAYLLEDTDA